MNELPKASVRVLRPDGTSQIFPQAEVGERVETRMRRFILDRLADTSGVSGVGNVAEGVAFGDGTVVLRWNTELVSTAIYNSVSDLLAIHGHNGLTQLRWVDG